MSKPHKRRYDRPVDPLVRELIWIRVAAGVSQRALAEAMGSSQSYISEVERGVLMPGVPVLTRMGAVLGVRATWVSIEPDEAVEGE